MAKGKKMTLDDEATANEELRRSISLQYRKPSLPHTGKCHECEVETTGVFCCAECRETNEQRMRFKNSSRV